MEKTSNPFSYWFENFSRMYFKLVREKILLFSFLLVIIPFLITRLPFFLYFPLANIDVDTFNYYTLVDQINNGLFPKFIIRTPGYPLFLKLVFTFFNSNMAVICVQNIITLFTALFFVYAVHISVREKLKTVSLLAALGIGVFITSIEHLEADTSLLTESIYVNGLLLFFAFLLLAFMKGKNVYWVLSSTAAAMVILCRPSGMFLIVVIISTVFFMIFNSYKKRTMLLLLMPGLLLLLVFSVYNYFTLGSFSISNFSEHALVSYTSLFFEKGSQFSPLLNEGIETCQSQIKPYYKKVIFNSMNIENVRKAMAKYYNKNRVTLFNFLRSSEKKDEFNLYMKWRPILRKVALHALKSHPEVYLKFAFCNFMYYFFYIKYDDDFYNSLKKRYIKLLNAGNLYENSLFKNGKLQINKSGMRIYYTREYAECVNHHFLKFFLKEYRNSNSPPFPDVSISSPTDSNQENGSGGILIKDSDNLVIQQLFLKHLHEGYSKMYSFLFRNRFWVYFFFFSFIFALKQTVNTRFHNRIIFFMLLLTGSALLHGVVVSMTTFPINRYAYTLEFVNYLSFFLFPLLLIERKKKFLQKKQ